jgi:hypothetical protein
MKLRRILLQRNLSTSDLPLCYGGMEFFVSLRQNGVGPNKTCSMKGNVKRKIFS